MLQPYSHKIAEVYEDGIIQRRVNLENKREQGQHIRRRNIQRLHNEVAKAAARQPQKTFWIELKNE